MKKEYMKPQIEVTKIEVSHLMAGSGPLEWGGEVGSRSFELDDLDEE